MAKETCSNCSASKFVGDQGICVAHPPTATVILLPQGPTPVSSIVTVPRDHWCREWQEGSRIVLMGGH